MQIIPEKDLFDILKKVENPGRYVGGEYGSIIKSDAVLKIALCFPEIYEIGMSNQAISILYSIINSIDSISCERVFVPAEDFESELRNISLPLYSLETGTPIKDFDIIAFSFGYELLATNLLSVLDLSGIPLTSSSRTESDPLVIAGGPAITNPLPFSKIIDGIYIGEAEGELPEILRDLADIKRRGGRRKDLFERLLLSSFIWSHSKRHAVRAVWKDFGVTPFIAPIYSIPSIRTIQDHGVVEIMRGCPNGCRFCHAGIHYRPFRMKSFENIYQEVHLLIHKLGYREITLSSLSSADYSEIQTLLRNLNKMYANQYISFSLPSLHVESFGLSLLSEIAEVRKSGLTFAVETPLPEYQLCLNKAASKEKILTILKEAKQKGWKAVKFYFMIGLPFSREFDEISEIKNFIENVYYESKLQINLNLGTFIPKPHTPFQWSFQFTEKESFESLSRIKREIKPHIAKISYHSPFLSYLEGVISRGDERVGDLILAAFMKGARFDAWDEKVKKNVWREIFDNAGWDLENEICSERELDKPLPWDSINLGVTKKYLSRELEKSYKKEQTFPCSVDCDHVCGVCGKDLRPSTETKIESLEELDIIEQPANASNEKKPSIHEFYRVLYSYSKTGKAVFIPHLSLMTIFERSFLRAGFDLRFTAGFNPKPVLEFAQPLPVGASSLEEIACVDLCIDISSEDFISRLNSSLPKGILILQSFSSLYREGEKKRPSLMSLYGGGIYEIETTDPDILSNIVTIFDGALHAKILMKEAHKVRLSYITPEGGLGFFAFLKDKTPDDIQRFNINKLSSFAKSRTGDITSFLNKSIYT